MTIAVVGLGQMGGGIAASLARTGAEVLGVDPQAPQTPDGVTRTELVDAVERADVLVLSLPGGAQVDQVVAGVLEAPAPRLVIDTSTCAPDETRARAQRLGEKRHTLVDAPVSGGSSGAWAGELTVFLGCPDSELDHVRSVLQPLASRINHVGDVGAGHTAKLLNNLLCGIHLCAARTLMGVSQETGVDPEALLSAINTASGRSAVTEVNLPRWVLSESFDSGFPVGLMARDVDLATELAEKAGAASPLVVATAQMWQDLGEQVGRDEDFNRMVTG